MRQICFVASVYFQILSEKCKIGFGVRILEVHFPLRTGDSSGKNEIFFKPCFGAFSEPPLWIQSAVCPTRLAPRLCVVGCVRPNPVQFQSRQSIQPAWSSTAEFARETKTAFRQETASCTLPKGRMH